MLTITDLNVVVSVHTAINHKVTVQTTNLLTCWFQCKKIWKVIQVLNMDNNKPIFAFRVRIWGFEPWLVIYYLFFLTFYQQHALQSIELTRWLWINIYELFGRIIIVTYLKVITFTCRGWNPNEEYSETRNRMLTITRRGSMRSNVIQILCFVFSTVWDIFYKQNVPEAGYTAVFRWMVVFTLTDIYYFTLKTIWHLYWVRNFLDEVKG
jgi:hypothetical protein